MTGPITWEAIAYLMVLVASLGGVWLKIEARIKAKDVEIIAVKERLEQVRAHGARDLDAFKLIVAERYIRAEDLDKIEKRQIESETRMTKAIEKLAERIDRLLRVAVKSSED